MSRLSQVLLLCVLAEVVIGGYFVAQRLRAPIPPQADWSLLDPATANQIRAEATTCHSGKDWRDLAELYMSAGCFAESEACHRVTCELDPTNAVYARQWGLALERLALVAEANSQYRRAIDLGIRQSDECRYFIARNLLREENVAEAGLLFTEGRALDANQYELARLQRRQGELSQATETLGRVAREQANTLQINLLSYRLALDRGDAKQAAVFADRVRYSPQKLRTPFDEEAQRIIAATQSLGPNLTWKQARELIESERFGEAERVLAAANDIYRSSQVIELQAEVALRQGKYDQAIRWFEEFQEQNGPAARIIARIGDAHDSARRPEQARTKWLRAAQLEAGADLKAIHHKVAASYSKAGDKLAADRHLAHGHYYVGRDLLQLGHPDKSISYFEATTKHDPEFVPGWFYLGESRRFTNQQESAAAAYLACLRLNPNHGRAIAALAALEAE